MGVVLFACIAIIVMCNSYDTYEQQNVNRIKLINEKPKAVVKEKITGIIKALFGIEINKIAVGKMK